MLVLAGDELFTLTQQTQQTQQTKQAESTIQFAEEAKDIVKAIGGANNIQAATHCVTRLRFALELLPV